MEDRITEALLWIRQSDCETARRVEHTLTTLIEKLSAARKGEREELERANALRAEVQSAQDSYAVLRTILTQGYTGATADPEVASDVPLIDLARAVCNSLQPLRAERDAEAAGRDDLGRRLNLATEAARQSDRSLYAIRGALDGTAVPPPGDSLARQVYETAQLAADFRRDMEGLRAIVEGRTAAPTDAEIEAHWRAGGTWLHQSRLLLTEPSTAARCALYQRESGGYLRWMPLDKDGRPCAWPVVTP